MDAAKSLLEALVPRLAAPPEGPGPGPGARGADMVAVPAGGDGGTGRFRIDEDAAT